MLNGLFKPKNGSTSAPTASRGWRVDLQKRFILGEKTSQGSMSRTYRAVDRDSNKTVCLKVQLREKCEAAASRVAEERPPEGEVGYRIVHPHVVHTFDWGYTSDDEQFIVMEYVDGVTLEHVIGAIKLGLRGKMKILGQAAAGFAGIHQAGFIHHDINPRNVLINRQNQVKIIDFGLSVPNTPAFHKPGNRTGCLAYMAPELIRREATDHRLDIFGFGALAFEFLTGRLPYEGGTGSMATMLQRINQEPMDPAVANPKLSEELCSLLRRALAPRKADRYPSMADLAAELARVPVKRDSDEVTPSVA